MTVETRLPASAATLDRARPPGSPIPRRPAPPPPPAVALPAARRRRPRAAALRLRRPVLRRSSRPSGCSRCSTRPGSPAPRTELDVDRMTGSGWTTTLACFSDPFFWNALWNTFTIGVLSTVPQLLMALGLAHLLNYRLRGPDVLAGRDADARTPPRWPPRRWSSRCSSAATRAWSTGLLALRRDRPGRLAATRLDGPDRHLGHRHLALDRLQRADLPGRDAGDPGRPVRGGRDRRRQPLAAVPARHAARRCARRSCSPSSSPPSAPPSSSASRCCSAAAANGGTARPVPDPRRCTCTSRAGNFGTSGGRRRSPG